MGFFKKAFNFVKKVVTAPRAAIAKVTEKIGDILYENSSFAPVEVTGEVLQSLGKALMPKCYRKETASVSDIVDTGVVCKGFYDDASRQTEAKLDISINKAEEQILTVKTQLQIIVSEEIFDRIKNCITTQIFDEIKNNALDRISELISTSNSEFESLLGIDSDIERSQKCREYGALVMEETLASTNKKIENKRNTVVDDMLEIVMEYAENLEVTWKNKKEEQKKLIAEKDNPEFITNRFSDKAIDISFLSCVLTATENNS